MTVHGRTYYQTLPTPELLDRLAIAERQMRRPLTAAHKLAAEYASVEIRAVLATRKAVAA